MLAPGVREEEVLVIRGRRACARPAGDPVEAPDGATVAAA
jgi:hypothetical protein